MIPFAVIFGYILVAWIAAFIIGMWNRVGELDEFEWIMAILWPIFLLCLLVAGLGYFVSWIWSFTPGKPMICNTMSKLALVFQPWVLGTMLMNRIDERKNKKFLEEKAKKEQEFPKGADCHGKY